MRAGRGAERFAEAEGLALVENKALICDRKQARYETLCHRADEIHPSHSFLPGAPSENGGADTVGCVARDETGRLVAATPTGGTPFKPPGRIGDAPIPGVGFYATDAGAASATGWGEAIAAVTLTSRSVIGLDNGAHPKAVVRNRLLRMYDAVTNPEGYGATGGLLLMDDDGRAAWAYMTSRMARDGWHSGNDLWGRCKELIS